MNAALPGGTHQSVGPPGGRRRNRDSGPAPVRASRRLHIRPRLFYGDPSPPRPCFRNRPPDHDNGDHATRRPTAGHMLLSCRPAYVRFGVSQHQVPVAPVPCGRVSRPAVARERHLFPRGSWSGQRPAVAQTGDGTPEPCGASSTEAPRSAPRGSGKARRHQLVVPPGHGPRRPGRVGAALARCRGSRGRPPPASGGHGAEAASATGGAPTVAGSRRLKVCSERPASAIPLDDEERWRIATTQRAPAPTGRQAGTRGPDGTVASAGSRRKRWPRRSPSWRRAVREPPAPSTRKGKSRRVPREYTGGAGRPIVRLPPRPAPPRRRGIRVLTRNSQSRLPACVAYARRGSAVWGSASRPSVRASAGHSSGRTPSRRPPRTPRRSSVGSLAPAPWPSWHCAVRRGGLVWWTDLR